MSTTLQGAQGQHAHTMHAASAHPSCRNRFLDKVYPTLLLVLVVCFIYAVISPFIMPAGAVFFSLAYVVYKHQV